MGAVIDFIFLGFEITANSDCSHEIKRCLLLGRIAMINLDSVLESRDIILPFHTVHGVITTLMAESEEELKSLLMKVKESEKFGFKTHHSKNEYHGIQSHQFMTNRWGNNGNSDRLYLLELQNQCRW